MSKCPLMCALTMSLVLAPLAAQASPTGLEIAGQVSEVGYRHYLDNVLYTHDGHNRMWGPEHDLARDDIVAVFESFGLEVELHPFQYGLETYYNVVATQVGTVHPDQQLIVGAHYDSYCYQCDSAPGADDNASGVAGVLEIARVLSQYAIEYTIKYIAFDREEQWMVGSEAYADDHVDDDIVGMINMDMIAWDSGDYSVRVTGETGSDPLKYAMALAMMEYAPDLLVLVIGDNAGDHEPFEWAGFQATGLSEDDAWTIWGGDGNPCYHEPCDSVDVPDYLSYDFGADIVRSVAGYLADEASLDVSSRDCDRNGQLDSEQIALDPWLDCNSDGTIDTCELLINDCNTNGVPDDCDIADLVSKDENDNGVPDECECHAPTDPPGEASDAVPMNRYLEFVPGNGGQVTALRVTLETLPAPFDDHDGEVMWVGPPEEISENAGYTDPAGAPEWPTFTTAVLRCEPHYMDWGTLEALYVYGVGVVPGGVYDIQAIDEACSPELEVSYSAPLELSASIWGDVVKDCTTSPCGPPDGIVSVTTDVTAVLDKYKNLEGAPRKARSDVEPDEPDLLVNITDVTRVLDAFLGFTYPFSGPTSCS